MANRELVILLHGIMRSAFDMLPLTLYLRRHGYDALNILYPSRSQNIESLTDFVERKIKASKNYNPDKTLHFVTHSMGGLIARYYIATRRPAHLGKVVMLSTPNSGSEMADFLQKHKILGPVYAKVFGPAGQQLTTHYNHIPTPIDYPLGIIAGIRSLNPLSPWALPRRVVGEHDGIVPVSRTYIDGMADHITMPTSHGLMMFNPKVMGQTLKFLQNGKFESAS